MCSNYRPVTRMDRLLTFFGVERGKDEPTADVWPTDLAPFIRLSAEGQEGGKPALVVEDGNFGLRPGPWAELKYGRRTYNARTETVHELTSFKRAWANGQRCIIPAEAIYEPNYESGKAVRWLIQQPGEVPMGIAGVYARFKGPDGRDVFSFAMLTVNADSHPFMRRFHKPDDEKRMVVILAPEEYEAWLKCSVAEAPDYFRQWTGPLDGYPAPLTKSKPAAKLPPPQDELF